MYTIHGLLVIVRKLVCLLSQEKAASTIELFAPVHWSWAQVQEQAPRAHGHNELISES